MAVYLGENQVAMKGGFSGGGAATLQNKTITPTEESQVVTPDSGYDGLNKVTVRAIDSKYVGSNVPKKSGQAYIPGTTNITIASGQYLTGAQVIKGDSNLVESNIRKGVSIFGKPGTYEGEGIGGIDTSDATATADDIAKNKTAYVNGEKITGNVPVYENNSTGSPCKDIVTGTSVVIFNTSPLNVMLKNAQFNIPVELNNFGNATAADVVADKTFTSVDGYKIRGTYVPPSDTGGIDTSDATATASDIAKDKTAYVNGEKVTGTVIVITGKTAYSTKDITGSSSYIHATSYPIIAMFKGAQVSLSIPLSQLGDATAADVAAGKTFTSSAGLKVTGTASTSSGNTNGYNCESYFISDVNNLNVQMTNTNNVRAYGYAVNGYQKYMFCGDKYTNVAYTISTAYTTLSLSIVNGYVEGLPDLSAGSLLITATK